MELSSSELSLIEHFSVIRDPRRACGKKHDLKNIFCIAVCAILGGCDSWVEVELYGKEKFEWLSKFLDLSNGIPSHDTFGRVFSIIDPKEFEQCFTSWVNSLRKSIDREIVSIDGKTLRRSFDKANSKLPFHIVSAWSSDNGLSLGQVQVDKKSNEIKAIPKLLEVLALKGCIVTIDAMGSQKKIVEKIVNKKADYVLTLKANQKNLYSRAKSFFEEHEGSKFQKLDHGFYETKEKAHGRYEERSYYLTSDINFLKPIKGWTKLNSVGMVVAKRTLNGKTSTQTRYFISSLKKEDIDDFSKSVRTHWGIENTLHWTLDVCFREDESRVRKKYAAQNLALMRKIALNLIKQDKKTKGSVRCRRLKASWNDQYALDVLLGKNSHDSI